MFWCYLMNITVCSVFKEYLETLVMTFSELKITTIKLKKKLGRVSILLFKKSKHKAEHV